MQERVTLITLYPGGPKNDQFSSKSSVNAVDFIQQIASLIAALPKEQQKDAKITGHELFHVGASKAMGAEEWRAVQNTEMISWLKAAPREGYTAEAINAKLLEVGIS